MTRSMTHVASLKPFFFAWVLGLCALSARAEGIPKLNPVPASTAPGLTATYAARRSALEAERSAFMDHAAAFNAKKADDQNDAEFSAINAERSAYILKVKAFNKDLAAALGYSAEVDKLRAKGKTVARASEIKGDFHILLKDGRTFAGADAAEVPLDGNIRLLTGDNSEAKLVLSDGTYFQLRENADMTITSFDRDPQTSEPTLVGKLKQGVLHWVHVLEEPRAREHLSIRMAAAVLAVRGTDVELDVAPDGSGVYRLHTGIVDVTDALTGKILTLKPGEQVHFDPAGSLGGAQPIATDTVRTN